MKPNRAILSIVLAFVVLLSSTSFTISAHLCGGDIQTLGFLKKAEACEKMKQKTLPSCHAADEDNAETTENSCCEDTLIENEAQEKLRVVTAGIEKLSPQFVVLFVNAFFDFSSLSSLTTTEEKAFEPFSPPYKLPDIHIWNQSFLI